MKSFLGVVTKRNNDRCGNPRDLLTLYRVKRNKLECVASRIDIGYRADWQAAVEHLKAGKHLPKSAPISPYELERAGVARVQII